MVDNLSKKSFSVIILQLQGHGLSNYKDTTTKCRLHWCLIEFIDWRHSQHVGIFYPVLWAIATLTFSLVHLPSTPPFPKPKYNNTDSLWLEVGGGGCWVVLETIFSRCLTLYIWPDSETTKLPYHPKQKPRRGWGLRQINTCRKIPLQIKFF